MAVQRPAPARQQVRRLRGGHLPRPVRILPNRPPYEGPETPETFKPFGVGYVELPNQVRVETRIQTEDIAKLRIGMEMDLVVEKFIERDGKDIIAYFFRPADES